MADPKVKIAALSGPDDHASLSWRWMGEHHDEANFEQGVMVDVGDGAGALLIYTDDELRGQEIEISPLSDDTKRAHTDVLRRRIATGEVCAAVFGSLAEGTYRLWHETLAGPREVTIIGGVVTELDWRTGPGA